LSFEGQSGGTLGMKTFFFGGFFGGGKYMFSSEDSSEEENACFLRRRHPFFWTNGKVYLTNIRNHQKSNNSKFKTMSASSDKGDSTITSIIMSKSKLISYSYDTDSDYEEESDEDQLMVVDDSDAKSTDSINDNKALQKDQKTFAIVIARDQLKFLEPPRQRPRCIKRGPYQHYVRGAFQFQVWTNTGVVVSTFLMPLKGGNQKRLAGEPKFNHTKQIWTFSFSGPASSKTLVVSHPKMHPIRINL